ncbi:MAG: hypothetical protein WCT50_04105 [Patescibacteria group bacterium]
MKITLCGSIAFYDEMLDVKRQLEVLGHEVKLPISEVMDEEGNVVPIKEYYERRKAETSETGWIWDRKEAAIRAHFEKIEWSEAVLVLNYDKNGIANYIGGNTFLEIGLAFHLKEKIFLLNPIPEINYKEELLGMKLIVINSDLTKIK